MSLRSDTAICFDLDGTITREEILPCLAQSAGLYDEIDALTRATIAGTLPFESSFRLRVRLLRELPLDEARAAVGRVRLQTQVVDFIKRNPSQCFIVTGNLDVWIGSLVEQIGCAAFTSIATWEGNELEGISEILDKGNVVDSLRERFARIVAVGDGMNDVPMFSKADRGIAYGGVHPPVSTLIQMADYVTYSPEGLCNILNTL